MKVSLIIGKVNFRCVDDKNRGVGVIVKKLRIAVIQGVQILHIDGALEF